MKIAAMLLMGLALTGGGCASPGTSAAQAPAGRSMTRDERVYASPLWYVGYWTLYFGGEVLAGH